MAHFFFSQSDAPRTGGGKYDPLAYQREWRHRNPEKLLAQRLRAAENLLTLHGYLTISPQRLDALGADAKAALNIEPLDLSPEILGHIQKAEAANGQSIPDFINGTFKRMADQSSRKKAAAKHNECYKAVYELPAQEYHETIIPLND